jgi:hypothetical protein
MFTELLKSLNYWKYQIFQEEGMLVASIENVQKMNGYLDYWIIIVDYWNIEYLEQGICLEWLLKGQIMNDYWIVKINYQSKRRVGQLLKYLNKERLIDIAFVPVIIWNYWMTCTGY